MIQELVEKLILEGKTDEIEPELLKIDHLALKKADAEDWHYHLGVQAFRSGRRELAMERFLEAYKKFPKSAKIAFSLGQEYEHLGNIKKMLELFAQAIFPKVPSTYAMTEARYAYLWDQPVAGMKYLEKLWDAYISLGIGDDHFVYVRGLPFFNQAFSYYLVFAWMDGMHLNDVMSFLEYLEAEIGDINFDLELLKTQIHVLGNSDKSKLLKVLKNKIEECKAEGEFSEFYELRAAAIEVKNLDFEAAEKKLRQIAVSADFKWLEDVKVLLLAELAGKYGDAKKEERLLQKFLKNQPRLLEPDHALEFQLLEYQERLKKIYQEGIKNKSLNTPQSGSGANLNINYPVLKRGPRSTQRNRVSLTGLRSGIIFAFSLIVGLIVLGVLSPPSIKGFAYRLGIIASALVLGNLFLAVYQNKKINPPPPFVSEADGDDIVVEGAEGNDRIRESLEKLGFSIVPESTEYMLRLASDKQKAEIFAKLRDLGLYFSWGKEWNPAELFLYYRDDKNFISGPFKSISWSGPGKWTIWQHEAEGRGRTAVANSWT